MSTTIDEKVVAMKFDNAQFERGVSKTMSSLDGLKKGLNLDGATKSLQGLDAAGKSFDISHLARGVDAIASKFTALGIIGVTALVNIANKAFAVGSQLISSLTVDPIKAGLDEYETKLGSIQTILANTSHENTNLGQVTEVLDRLNKYSDQTIYNFQEMTRNIGTFTAAGVSLETSANAIKGIANLAAVSGSNSQQASSAMYQLSQALAAGKVSLMDWNSVVNAGMGGKVFQDALMETARVHGVAVDQIVADAGGFRGSLETGWLTSSILTDTLMKFTGDLTDAQLASMGYTEEQIRGIQEMAKTANDAATKVKTFSQLMSTLQESAQSGWAQTWEIIFGDFEEAKELWTSVNNVLGGMIGASAEARNAMLEDWKALGGRTVLIDALKNAFEALMSIFKPIQEAFREIFPPTTGQQLYDITVGIRDFMASLKLGGQASEDLKRTFKGLFAVLDIGWMILQQVFGLFGKLFGSVQEGSGGFLSITGNIGDFLVKVRDAIKEGGGLAKVFEVIADVLRKLAEPFAAVFKAIDDGDPLQAFADVWQNIAKALQAVWTFLQPVVEWFKGAWQEVKTAVSSAFKEMDFNVLVGLLNAGLIGGFILMVKKFIDKLPDLFGGIGGGIFDTIKEAFGGLTSTMSAMQDKLKAETLLKIATAIAVLTASIVVLSFIDTEKLAVSLGAISIMMGQLMGAMAVFDKITAGAAMGKMALLSANLILLGTALLVMAGAVAIFSTMNWDELARGLTGMAGALVILMGAGAVLGKMSGSMAQAAGGILVMGIALNVLGGALTIFSTLSWDEILRSLAAMGGTMAIVLVTAKMAQSSAQGAAAMMIISTALLVLGSALLVMAKMDWDSIGRALATLAGSLAIMAVGVNLMQGSIAGAAAMAIVSVGILILSQAFQEFAKLSWDEIGRGLVALGGSLGILALAMALMGIPIVLLGAVGLAAAAASMMLLAPALVLLGTMSWDAIGAGLTMLASALGIIALGGVLLIAAIPGLLGLGTAILLIGAGAMMAGIGIGAFALGLGTLAAIGPVAAESIKMAVMTLISLIPMALAALAQGIIDFALVIATGGVEITAAMVTVLTSLITAIGTVAPLIIETLWNLVMMMVDTLVANVPTLVDSGLKLLIGILEGIGNNIGRVVETATTVVVNFINAIGAALPRIIQAGVNLIINFVNGIANAIRDNSARMQAAGRNLADAIIDGMVGGISSGIQSIINAAKRVAQAALDAAKNLLGINSPSKEFMKIGMGTNEGFSLGIYRSADMVTKATEGVGQSALTTMKQTMAGLASAMSADIDMSPTIRPVLDLTTFKKDASKIGSMMSAPTLTLGDTNASARAASAAYRATQEDSLSNGPGENGGVRDIHYTQINNSPKALPAAEIYRQTKNQLSKAKEELPQ